MLLVIDNIIVARPIQNSMGTHDTVVRQLATPTVWCVQFMRLRCLVTQHIMCMKSYKNYTTIFVIIGCSNILTTKRDSF